MSFLWVPSHIGIVGKKEADIEARRAILNGSPSLTLKERREFNTHLKDIFSNLEQLSWDIFEGTNKLYELKPKIFTIFPNFPEGKIPYG